MKNYDFINKITKENPEAVTSAQADYFTLFITACKHGKIEDLNKMAKDSDFDIAYMLKLNDYAILFNATRSDTFDLAIWNRVQELIESKYNQEEKVLLFSNMLKYKELLIPDAIGNYNKNPEVIHFIINLAEKYLPVSVIRSIMRSCNKNYLMLCAANTNDERIVRFILSDIDLYRNDYIDLYKAAAGNGNTTCMNYLIDHLPTDSLKISMMNHFNGQAFWNIMRKSQEKTINTMNFIIKKTLLIQPEGVYNIIISQDCEAFKQLIEKGYNKAILFLMESIKQSITPILAYNDCTLFRKSFSLQNKDMILTFIYSAAHFITNRAEAENTIGAMGNSLKNIEVKYIYNKGVREIYDVLTNPEREKIKNNMIDLVRCGFPIHEPEFRTALLTLRLICKKPYEVLAGKSSDGGVFLNVLSYLLPCSGEISKLNIIYSSNFNNCKRKRDDDESWAEKVSKRPCLEYSEVRH